MGDVEDFVDDTVDFVGDVWDEATGWVEEEVFGAPSEEEIAQMEQQAAAAAAAAGQTTVSSSAAEIRAQRKKELAAMRDSQNAEKASLLSEQDKSAGLVAGMRMGQGGMKSKRGAEKARVRSQKYKSSAPLKIGMKRPQ